MPNAYDCWRIDLLQREFDAIGIELQMVPLDARNSGNRLIDSRLAIHSLDRAHRFRDRGLSGLDFFCKLRRFPRDAFGVLDLGSGCH